uniref:Uncharacterized protein n=1 Tax=Rangifer tarandus platyrhynchus TaxID=3082113 RepID=A0ACB0EIV6_RANTA|nr:unnamed protein product [Rangifer tarandus platyrhynchus]
MRAGAGGRPQREGTHVHPWPSLAVTQQKQPASRSNATAVVNVITPVTYPEGQEAGILKSRRDSNEDDSSLKKNGVCLILARWAAVAALALLRGGEQGRCPAAVMRAGFSRRRRLLLPGTTCSGHAGSVGVGPGP